MSEILICTVPGDVHGRAVEWSLKSQDAKVQCWLLPDFPSKTMVSVEIDNIEKHEFSLVSDHISLQHLPEVVWYRREGNPVIADNIDPADEPAAKAESKRFMEGLHIAFDQHAIFCINPASGRLQAKSKLRQLSFAREHGLNIPATLITNDPKKVKAFHTCYGKNIIIKSFTCPAWYKEGSSFFPFSTKVSEELLEDCQSISAAPAIYQELLEKEFEVRTLFMGKEHLSIKLNSQAFEETKTDWRGLSAGIMSCEPYKLPEDIANRCIALMKSLNIVTGSFDFVVKPNQEIVFLEVNEMGQFLWMEVNCPEIPCLQVFTEFMLSKNKNYIWDKKIDSNITYQKFLDSKTYDYCLENEHKNHVSYSNFSATFEQDKDRISKNLSIHGL